MRPSTIFALLAFLVGLSVGAAIPDMDQRVGLVHRSIITHGLPLLFVWLVAVRGGAVARSFAIGFGVANAVHLAFDLFPRAWMGTALIYIPLLGQSTAVFSWSWIAVGTVAGLYLAFASMRHVYELLLLVLGLVLSLALESPFESRFWPVTALLVALVIVSRLPSGGVDAVHAWWAKVRGHAPADAPSSTAASGDAGQYRQS